MSDLVVTVPKQLWLEWIAEGDAVGEAATGIEWAYWVGGRPGIEPGERLYVVSWGQVRGWAPVTRVALHEGRWGICREGGAVACQVPNRRFDGFRGFRKRWWERSEEIPYPDWKTDFIPPRMVERARSMGMVLEKFALRSPQGRYYTGMSAIGPKFGELTEAKLFDSRELVAKAYGDHWAMGECEVEVVHG